VSARRRGEAGQAAVELALCLPLLAALALGLVQVGFIVRDQVVLTQAAREAAREAAVTAEPGAPRRAALASTRLDPRRLSVAVHGRGRPGSRVTVTLRYASATDLPLVGPLLGDVHLSSTAAMRVES
jgi:Flp pilus assembly protein TadG